MKLSSVQIAKKNHSWCNQRFKCFVTALLWEITTKRCFQASLLGFWIVDFAFRTIWKAYWCIKKTLVLMLWQKCDFVPVKFYCILEGYIKNAYFLFGPLNLHSSQHTCNDKTKESGYVFMTARHAAACAFRSRNCYMTLLVSRKTSQMFLNALIIVHSYCWYAQNRR